MAEQEIRFFLKESDMGTFAGVSAMEINGTRYTPEELSAYITHLEQAGEEVLQVIDYAHALRRPSWVRQWLLGTRGDERHPEHAAIAKLRALLRATRGQS